MISIEQIEAEIESLPNTDQIRLLAHLSERLGSQKRRSVQTNDEMLMSMANDPEIQREMAAISREFAVADADGLGS